MTDSINISHSKVGDTIIDTKGNRWRVSEIDDLGYRWCHRKVGKHDKQIQKFFPEGPALMKPGYHAVKVVKCRPRKTRPAVLAMLKQNDEDLKAERRIRELIVAAHTLTLIDHANTYPLVTVRVEDLQALLRLLDRARLNTKVRKL